MEEEYKGHLIVPAAGMMKQIKAVGKGSVVLALRGLYTSVLEARKAIDAVVSQRKGKAHGKAKSTS